MLDHKVGKAAFGARIYLYNSTRVTAGKLAESLKKESSALAQLRTLTFGEAKQPRAPFQKAQIPQAYFRD